MGHPSLELSSKTAVVIGGTSGIGLAIAQGLAQAGANVIPTGRRPELVDAAAEQIKNLGRQTLAVPCDVTSHSSVQSLCAAARAEFGEVEILVNCAGVTKRKPTLEVSDSEWNSILETNLNGTLRACQVFGDRMGALRSLRERDRSGRLPD